MIRRQYQYRPLEGSGTTRLLTLLPGQPDDPLVGTLNSVPIDSAPSYEALSYVWAEPGPPGSSLEILIHNGDNGQGVLTLQGGSIFAALRQLRLPNRPRQIWADQCCINQDDLAEKSRQVQDMHLIFRKAAHILVWLGSDTKKEAASAFSLVYRLHEVLNCQPGGSPRSDSGAAELALLIQENHMALAALTHRRWFRRGWIVQEIGAGTRATVHWGDATVDWDMLADVCERLKSHHHLRSALGMRTSDISFLHRRFVEPNENTHHANRFNFIYELQRARHLNFSDDRDRVFAFLGHFSIRSLHPLACGPVSVTVDYTKTVKQSYIDLSVRMLRQNPSAACILLAAVQHSSSSLPSCQLLTRVGLKAWMRDENRLPSWVPDWRRSEGIILAEPICPHRAHGESSAKLEILGNDNVVLQIHGVEIDTIKACSQRLTSDDFYTKKTPIRLKTKAQRLWHELCKKERFNLDDKYRNGQTAFFALMQTLSNGCVQAAGHKSVPYHEVPENVWLQKAARYIVDTHEAPDDITEDIWRAAKGAEAENEDDNWCRWATSASDGRTFSITQGGYYVLGPAALEAGDVVCVLFGCKVPFCLRPVGKGYLLVGECYVHGLMNGEAMDMLAQDKLSENVFEII
ncbi:heterokaryon incompatibility protein-domain-containing protein [Stachybotrys elegans]|uniref:Heterokaryon incompatibility protein-domain-containing protein n=1 Tax=Stachybotrys elegans TaxID=80388 RepID=A0A8K0SF60_9HYPO|nr:heterokaryon incompatibility protein-domain-containing protein [Stachybotrys elegans]